MRMTRSRKNKTQQQQQQNKVRQPQRPAAAFNNANLRQIDQRLAVRVRLRSCVCATIERTNERTNEMSDEPNEQRVVYDKQTEQTLCG
jgi:hypothetical protein